MIRNRIRDLLGKGAEELPEETVVFSGLVTGGLTQFRTVGPFEVDLDVVEVACTSGAVFPAATATLDVFNGTVAANKPIIAQFDPDTLVAQVPTVKAVTGNRRVTAGTPVTVRVVTDTTSPLADVAVKVRLERVLHEPAAKAHTYGAYPQ